MCGVGNVSLPPTSNPLCFISCHANFSEDSQKLHELSMSLTQICLHWMPAALIIEQHRADQKKRKTPLGTRPSCFTTPQIPLVLPSCDTFNHRHHLVAFAGKPIFWTSICPVVFCSRAILAEVCDTTKEKKRQITRITFWK